MIGLSKVADIEEDPETLFNSPLLDDIVREK